MLNSRKPRDCVFTDEGIKRFNWALFFAQPPWQLVICYSGRDVIKKPLLSCHSLRRRLGSADWKVPFPLSRISKSGKPTQNALSRDFDRIYREASLVQVHLTVSEESELTRRRVRKKSGHKSHSKSYMTVGNCLTHNPEVSSSD